MVITSAIIGFTRDKPEVVYASKIMELRWMRMSNVRTESVNKAQTFIIGSCRIDARIGEIDILSALGVFVDNKM
jgi:hypothetical protein